MTTHTLDYPRRSVWRAGRSRQRADLSSSMGFSLGKLFGVEIYIDWSLALIFAVISFNLGGGLLPSWHPDWSPALLWGTALGAALFFFASVLVHELSHALVAKHRGLPVPRITLFVFGGVAQLDQEPDSPTSEFLIASVGPLASLLLGLGAMSLGTYLAGVELAVATALEDPEAVRAALEEVSPWSTLLLWLGPVNIMLALFNIIPGFPLDGGRVLRSLLWAVTRDLRRATRWASIAGQGFAWLLMTLGIFDVLGGALGSGLWLLLIGWFLNHAARSSYQTLLVQQLLSHVAVRDLMRLQPARVPPEMRLAEFVRNHLLAGDQRVFPVERDGQLLGLVSFDDVRALPESNWSKLKLRDLMTSPAEFTMLQPDVPAARALQQLTEHKREQLPVGDGRRVLGLLVRGDVLRWLALRGNVEAEEWVAAKPGV
ncbi:MAG TPA: site-2 protease family protein [Polyangiaceae bacterium]|nr:site-2 protease family protein [Polyangiaceae bacterium]